MYNGVWIWKLPIILAQTHEDRRSMEFHFAIHKVKQWVTEQNKQLENTTQ